MTRAVAVRVLAALIALQVGVGGVALATVQEKPDRVDAGSVGATTTSAPGTGASPEGQPAPGETPAAPAEAAPGGPAPTAPGSSASSGGGANLSALPERPAPTQPGTYRYRVKMDGQASFGTFTTQLQSDKESDTVIERVPGPAGEVRDRVKQDTSQSSSGFSFSGQSNRERAWRNDGLYTTAEAGRGSGQSESGEGGGREFEMSCDWEPDIKELAFPLREGTAWTWDSRCESQSDDFDMKQRNQGNARVTGRQTAKVGGREVAVLVIQRRTVTDGEFSGESEGRQFQGTTHTEDDSIVLFAPSVSLVVKIDSKFKGTTTSPQAPGMDGRFQGEGRTELLSLDPT